MTSRLSLEPSRIDAALSALGELLEAAGAPFEIVVIGGAALQVLGLIMRPTADVDVVAILDQGGLQAADPLPTALADAAQRVAADFGLAADWLNPGPTAMLQWGLPEGFVERLTARSYGALTAHFASRFDQIHFKLFAFADLGGGRHEADLKTLHPTREELLVAAAWARTQDPSQGFRGVLAAALERLGVDDADLE
jgi:hypothetical protein